MRTYRGHDQALKQPGEAPRRRSLRSLGSEREPATLSYGGGALSPTSRQHAYKSAVLALGLSSYPLAPEAGAHHEAIIAIPTIVRHPMHTHFRRARARAFCMPARRTGSDNCVASWALRV